MTNGPGRGEILTALEQAFDETPHLQELPAEEVARRLVRGGYLQEEPPLPLVKDVLESTIEAEEPRQPFGEGATREGAMRGPILGGFRGQRQEQPMNEPLDLEAERRELEAMGWESLERAGKLVWRNPKSGHLYPQGAAISAVRRGRIDD